MTTKYIIIQAAGGTLTDTLFDSQQAASDYCEEAGYTQRSDEFGAHSMRYVLGNNRRSLEAYTDGYNGSVGIFEVEAA
jgi:hypothetical protein